MKRSKSGLEKFFEKTEEGGLGWSIWKRYENNYRNYNEYYNNFNNFENLRKKFLNEEDFHI
jgi:hypothetical protein